MFYISNKFWIETGAELIKSLLDYMKINSSKDELEDFISQKEYLNEDAIEHYEPMYINLVKSWDVVRILVLKIQEYKMKFGKRVDSVLQEEFVLLYKSLDPSEQYVYMFDGQTKESQDFLKTLNSLIERLAVVETVEPLLEFLGIALFQLIDSNYLGEFTDLYFWLMVECVVISRGYGPIVISEKDDVIHVMKLRDIILKDIKKYSLVNIATLEPFREILNIWLDRIELFRMNKINHY